MAPRRFTTPIQLPGNPTGVLEAVPKQYVDNRAPISVKDYGALGDGSTDDTTAIQNALNAATTGQTVIFPSSSGSYVISATLTVAAGSTVEATGATIFLKNSSNSRMLFPGNNVTIRGGTWDGNRANNAGTWPRACVYAVSISGLRLLGMTIKNMADQGVWLDGVSDVLIERCTITGCCGSGNDAAIFVYYTSGSPSNDIRIIDNYIDATAQNAGCIKFAANGIFMNRITVTGNILNVGGSVSYATMGIEMWCNGNNSGVRQVVIAGNVVTGSVTASTLVYGVSIGAQVGGTFNAGSGNRDIAITGNTVKSCRTIAYELIGNNLSITGNVANASGPFAVYGGDVNGGVLGCVISGNQIIDCVDANNAILLSGGSNGIANAVVNNNVITNPAGVMISCSGTVTGANISANVAKGVGAFFTATGTFTDAMIQGNRIDLAGSANTIKAININTTTCTDLSIVGNHINDAGAHGVYLNTAVVGGQIIGNYIRNCGNVGLSDTSAIQVNSSSSARITIAFNHLKGNEKPINLLDGDTYTVLGNIYDGNVNGNFWTGHTLSPVQFESGFRSSGVLSGGILDARVAATSAFNTTETILAGASQAIPLQANVLAVKDTFRFTIWGTCTSTVANNTTVRIRIGTNGSTADTAVFTAVVGNGAAAGTAQPFKLEGIMTIRTIGASATVHGSMDLENVSVTSNSTASTGISIFQGNIYIPTFNTFDSTAANYMILTAVTAASTTTLTVQGATLEKL